MGNNRKKASARRKYLSIGGVLVVLLTLALLLPGVIAKYIKQLDMSTIVKAKEFFFMSDLLKADGFSYTVNAGITSLDFHIYNYDGSSLSEMDISYTVSVDNGATVNGEAEITGTMAANSKGALTVTLGGLEAGESYTVTAQGVGGYSQTLSATFTVNAQGTAAYKHATVTEDYILLTVWTENLSGNVLIDIPAGLIPDATDPILSAISNYSADGYTAVSEIDSGHLDAYSSRSYRFFIDSYTGTGSDITVTVNGTEATDQPLDD